MDRRRAAPGRSEAAALARDLGCIHRSLAWERALIGLEAGEMDGFGDSVAAWLMELADRLDGPAWVRPRPYSMTRSGGRSAGAG